MIKEDCFAYMNGNCHALKELYCKKEECVFYKINKDKLSDEQELKLYRSIGTPRQLLRLKRLYAD